MNAGWQVAGVLYLAAGAVRLYRTGRRHGYAVGIAHGTASTLDMLSGGAR